MNKKQCFKSMWIPLSKRYPPKDEKLYLGWNDKTEGPILASGTEINRIKKFTKSKKNHMLNNTYLHIKEWMPIHRGG